MESVQACPQRTHTHTHTHTHKIHLALLFKQLLLQSKIQSHKRTVSTPKETERHIELAKFCPILIKLHNIRQTTIQLINDHGCYGYGPIFSVSGHTVCVSSSVIICLLIQQPSLSTSSYEGGIPQGGTSSGLLPLALGSVPSQSFRGLKGVQYCGL